MSETIRLALIDDDDAVLDALALFFSRRAVATACFSSADAFLATLRTDDPVAIQHEFDCIVADVRMPGLSGIELLDRLGGPMAPPVVLITGHGDVDMAVTALKAGATDFLEKPFDENRLLEKIRAAVAAYAERRAEAAEVAELRARADALPPRQREVMELAAAGLSNKEIGNQLNISPRTVENHRAWVMQRMGAKNLADLVRIVTRLV